MTVQKNILIVLIFLLNGCITPFIPRTNENKELLVVDGLITDQPDTNFIMLSKSTPLGIKSILNPASGCIVTLSDDQDNTFSLREKVPGTYVTDPSKFQGVTGRFYTLHINTNEPNNNLNYESYPVEMKPVPSIDNVYYEKVTIAEADKWNQKQEGCQIYVNTHDPDQKCKFFRWNFIETWEFRLPYDVPNWRCWVSSNSSLINIKNTSGFALDSIYRHPVNFVSNKTDRLKYYYSILVNQYSLNDDEYIYWEKLQKITETVGSLYDITPAPVPGNIFCLENPSETVLGYFCVSGRTSKRIFIKDLFHGLFNFYTDDRCISRIVPDDTYLPNLNISVWVLAHPRGFLVLTTDKRCADCTVRGTSRVPDFWVKDY